MEIRNLSSLELEQAGVKKIGYSKKEASLATSLSVRTLEYMINRGELKAHKFGSRVVIPASALEKLIEKGVTRPSGGADPTCN